MLRLKKDSDLVMQFKAEPFDHRFSQTLPHVTVENRKINGRYPLITNETTYDFMSPLFQRLYTQAPDEFIQKVGYKQTIFMFSNRQAKIQPLSLDFLEVEKDTEVKLEKCTRKEIDDMVSLEESEFLDWAQKNGPVGLNFAKLSASIKEHAREFFFRTHVCHNNQFMHVQSEHFPKGFDRKGFHNHELMC